MPRDDHHLPARIENVIARGTIRLGQVAGRTASTVDSFVEDWRIADLQLARAQAALREVRDLNARCQALYAAPGGPDPEMVSRLAAEFGLTRS